MPIEKDSKFRPVKSADRALELIEYIAGHEAGVSFNQILNDLDIPRSSLSGLLNTLLARHYIRRTPDDKRFQLGPKIVELSSKYRGDSGIIDSAQLVIKEIARKFGESAHVATLDRGEVVYLATEHSNQSMRIEHQPGAHRPSHATAVGKALLAFIDEEELSLLLPHELSEYTPHTITTLTELQRELTQIRRTGFAYDVEEYEVGFHCIAVPLFDEMGAAVASLGVSIPIARLNAVDVPELIQRLKQHAQDISHTKRQYNSIWKPGCLKVAWSLATLHVQPYQIMYQTIEQIRSSRNIDVIWTDAHEDAAKQETDVEQLLKLAPDVIIIHAVHTYLADALFNKAADQNIPAIAFQRPVRSAQLNYFIGGDTYEIARQTTEFVIDALNGEGNIAIISGDPYNDNARNISQGIYDTLRTAPHINVIADQAALSWSRHKAYQIAKEVLEGLTVPLDAFMVANDDMAGSVAKALDEYGLLGQVMLIGGDGDKPALERIKSGTQHLTSFQDWIELAKETLEFTIQVANDMVDEDQLERRSIIHYPPGPEVYTKVLPYRMITIDNVDELERFWEVASKLIETSPFLSRGEQQTT